MRNERSVQGTEASAEGLIFFCIQFVVMNMLCYVTYFSSAFHSQIIFLNCFFFLNVIVEQHSSHFRFI